MSLEMRYGTSLTMVFLGLSFSTGMPMFYFCLPVFFGAFYLVDKYLCTLLSPVVVRYFKTPPRYGSQLSKVAHSLYAHAVLVHLGVGFFMFSNKDIIQDDMDFDGKNIKDVMARTIPFADRIASTPSMLMFIAFFLMICVCVTSYVRAGCFCCRGTNAREGKTLCEQLSFKQLMDEYVEAAAELRSLRKGKIKLEAKLKNKLSEIGEKLKSYFVKYKQTEIAGLDPAELPESLLRQFFYEYEEVLSKASLQGLFSYRLMVSVAL